MTNMALTMIDENDFVTPTTINNNFTELDKLGVDYVIDKGMSGEWWFRKWNSGRLECGVDAKQFGRSDVHIWGGANSGLYATNQYTFGNYPFSFKSRPHTSISFLQDNTRDGRGSTIAIFNNDSPLTRAPSFEVVDSWNYAMEPICSIYACGFWK